MATTAACSCGVPLDAVDEDAFPDVFLAHVRAEHEDWPYPDLGVRLVGEAMLRLTGPTERLDTIGAVEVEPVMPDRLDDWLAYFDHDAFVDKPWAAYCYCLEQHGGLVEPRLGYWRAHRDLMIGNFHTGRAFGYLAYVEGRAAGWVNAALRANQVYGQGRPDDADTIAVSCFNIAPPYQGHALSGALLDRVIADGSARGSQTIEAYPPTSEASSAPTHRGTRELYLSRGFEHHVTLGKIDVMRLAI